MSRYLNAPPKSASLLDMFSEVEFSEMEPALRVEQVGGAQVPILIFDLSCVLAHFLIEKASRYRPDWSKAATIYPGIWSDVPQGYESALLHIITPYIDQHYGLARLDMKKIFSCYAMAVTKKSELQINQRYPHYDSFNPRQLAVVHYLCDESFGGTGFYRHRPTGIELMTEAKFPDFMQSLKSDMDVNGIPAAEYSGGNSCFEQLLACEAKLGRLVIYPSALLHAGLVNVEKNTELDPSKGRLTITSFIHY